MWTWFYRLASPPHFYALAGSLSRWLVIPALVLMLVAAWGGLFVAPPDYQQGDAFRIIYVHVPSAYLSMMVYVTMAVAGAIGLVWRIKLAHAVAASCAPIGASFTFAALVTGAVWGKPMWGTYWDWDPRLTSELILLFLYFGYMGLRSAFENLAQADRASAILAIAGVVNVPIIHFSVIWWASLHQGPTLSKLAAPSIPESMLWPLLTMILAFTLFFLGNLAARVQSEVLEREFQSRWAQDALAAVNPRGPVDAVGAS